MLLALVARYHDMADVVDFLVLRQYFDLAVQRDWKIGECERTRFIVLVLDHWISFRVHVFYECVARC